MGGARRPQSVLGASTRDSQGEAAPGCAEGASGLGLLVSAARCFSRGGGPSAAAPPFFRGSMRRIAKAIWNAFVASACALSACWRFII